MKKLWLLSLLVSGTTCIQAKQWHILPCDTQLPNRITLYDAVELDTVEAGDTLWFHQNSECYRTVSLNKKLTIKTYSSLCEPIRLLPCIIGIFFKSGSEGTVIENLIVRSPGFNVAKETISFRHVPEHPVPVKQYAKQAAKQQAKEASDTSLPVCKEMHE